MIEASRVVLASREDVWALIAEPYNLPDWWPAYSGVTPDRRGLEEGARWTVMRSRTPGFLRKPRGEPVIIRQASFATELAWRRPAESRRGGEAGRRGAAPSPLHSWTRFWRLLTEGARGVPRRAVARLYDLCQTAASL